MVWSSIKAQLDTQKKFLTRKKKQNRLCPTDSSRVKMKTERMKQTRSVLSVCSSTSPCCESLVLVASRVLIIFSFFFVLWRFFSHQELSTCSLLGRSLKIFEDLITFVYHLFG
jgi:hypothetical protein